MANVQDLLPIGTVVRVKGATKRLMIFGVKQVDAKTKELYDYIGVLYPEGNMGEEVRFMFNHENIDEIIFTGYNDEERQDFIGKLSAYYEKKQK